MNLSHFALHYGLLILSVLGVFQCVRVLGVVRLDMSALSSSGVNGPKKLIVLGRLNQSAFLLGAFAVLMAIGARVALASEYELDAPLVLTLIVSLNVVTLVLGLKEMTMRRNRAAVDAYYDSEHHRHRRSTDIGAVMVAQEAASMSQAAATLAQDAATIAQGQATVAQHHAADVTTRDADTQEEDKQ